METTETTVEFEMDLGRSLDGGRVFADVRLSYRRNGPKPAGVPELGISFEHTPKGGRRGGANSSSGQLSDLKFKPGSLGYAVQFVWKGYANNALHTGCEHQQAAGWEREGGYDLHPAEPCPVCGYKFGSAWRLAELPEDVIALVRSWQNAPKSGEPEGTYAEEGITAKVLDTRAPRPSAFRQSTGYMVELTFEGRTMVVPFYMGLGHTEPPTVEAVMECLVSDAVTYDTAGSFEYWATELGYETDSDSGQRRQAERTYRAVEKQTRELRDLLGEHYDRITANS